MSEPEMPAREPFCEQLKAGETYWWCACGRSNNQPFCDGSHAGSDFSPLEYVVTEEKNVALCNCKHSQGPPLCDGSHATL